ncbi:MAG: hypothetical protein EAZ16_03610 [Sphingobacteriales bacterium]|nr:MAG: hypothetical protein EAZ16_03610 [Sphingobacteriales bacterium]
MYLPIKLSATFIMIAMNEIWINLSKPVSEILERKKVVTFEFAIKQDYGCLQINALTVSQLNVKPVYTKDTMFLSKPP